MDSRIRDSVCSPATERVISVKIRIDDFPDGRALVCGATRFALTGSPLGKLSSKRLYILWDYIAPHHWKITSSVYFMLILYHTLA